jgi:hypothetical protein
MISRLYWQGIRKNEELETVHIGVFILAYKELITGI